MAAAKKIDQDQSFAPKAQTPKQIAGNRVAQKQAIAASAAYL
jgi:hypothetical protein